MFNFQMEESELTNFQFATLARISNDYPSADFLIEDGTDMSVRVTATDTEDEQTRVWRIDWEGDGYLAADEVENADANRNQLDNIASAIAESRKGKS